MQTKPEIPDRDFDALLKAAVFAAEKHRTQRRKDLEASPYINHPLAVARELTRHGVQDIVAIQAALLHDTVEDTETSEAELAESFGHDVAGVVMEVTDDKALPKQRRKELQVEHAPSMSDAAKLVKLGDKICNARDVHSNPPGGWDAHRRREYLEWTRRVISGCRGLNRGLEEEFDGLVETALSSISD